MKLRRQLVSRVAHQKRFMGLTVACVATIVAWGVLGQGTAFGQTDQQEDTFRNTALAHTNTDRANYSNAGEQPLALVSSTDPNYAVLNTGSQDWALHLASTGDLAHSSDADRTLPDGSVAGENLFITFDTANVGPDAVAKQMVDTWYSEYDYYDPKQPEAHVDQTGHYTQLVWLSTTTMGCGYAIGSYTVPAGAPLAGTVYNTYYGVCRYSPAGNVSGEYAANVPTPNSGDVASVFHFLPLPGNHSLSGALDLTGGGNTASSKQGQGATF
jgi:glioma pathogenesis-related protein 2